MCEYINNHKLKNAKVESSPKLKSKPITSIIKPDCSIRLQSVDNKPARIGPKKEINDRERTYFDNNDRNYSR